MGRQPTSVKPPRSMIASPAEKKDTRSEAVAALQTKLSNLAKKIEQDNVEVVGMIDAFLDKQRRAVAAQTNEAKTNLSALDRTIVDIKKELVIEQQKLQHSKDELRKKFLLQDSVVDRKLKGLLADVERSIKECENLAEATMRPKRVSLSAHRYGDGEYKSLSTRGV